MIRILAHRLGNVYMSIMLHVLNAVRNVAHLTPGIPSCRFSTCESSRWRVSIAISDSVSGV
eukprot:ANDGO_03700.mRNA.1 hypothetical protein